MQPTAEGERSMERALNDVLSHEIPLTTALGLRVESWSDETLRLTAPLAPNVNHKQTAFGGSVYAVAVLAGWGWLWCRLREEGATAVLVIQASDMDYRRPVDQDFEARCSAPPASAWQRCYRSFDRRGKGRVDLDVEVRCQGEEVARLRARYVVMSHDHEARRKEAQSLR